MMAMPFERSGQCSTIGGGGVSEGSSPGVMVETKVHAGVVSGRKGGRSWSSTEVPVEGAMVALIYWTPLSNLLEMAVALRPPIAPAKPSTPSRWGDIKMLGWAGWRASYRRP